VVGSDPHGFDGVDDGVGCASSFYLEERVVVFVSDLRAV
jgi:hypothetical protein